MTELIKIKVPDIGNFEQVDVIDILVKIGDKVGLEDPLITLESDKASMDIPSPKVGEIKEYKSAMLYVSDHGQSLGENNLYLHGIPKSIAPKEQLEIPFIVWVSDSSQKLIQNDQLTQHHVFHSVLNFLALDYAWGIFFNVVDGF